jgi:hypothetical protein
VTELGQNLIASLKEALQHERGEKMLSKTTVMTPKVKVVEIQKPTKDAKKAPQRTFRRPTVSHRSMSQVRAEMQLREIVRPRRSPKRFVDEFMPGAAQAAKVADEAITGLEKSIKENDIAEFTSVKQIQRDLGFWRAVRAYGLKQADLAKQTKKKR